MAIRVVRLGSERLPHEGLRIGTVRHPPRGVRKSELASRNYFDVWFPLLAPKADTLKLAKSARDWTRFERKYRKEMSTPESRAALQLLAALSHHVDFSVGCYCEDASRCHRSILQVLLADYGADVASAPMGSQPLMEVDAANS